MLTSVTPRPIEKGLEGSGIASKSLRLRIMKRLFDGILGTRTSRSMGQTLRYARRRDKRWVIQNGVMIGPKPSSI